MEFRFDRSALRPVKRFDDGRVRVEAYFTRAGIFEYVKQDGGIRRELRLPEDVFAPASVATFANIPVTNDHPPALLTTKNAREYQVGLTGDSVVREDDLMRGTFTVTDRETVDAMEGGKVQVSCGYACKVDYTPGVHPTYGRYDARQYDIRGNHLAIVDMARAGEVAAARMDGVDLAVQRADFYGVGESGGMSTMPRLAVTDVVDGHAHVVDMNNAQRGPVGYTSWARGADGDGHEHAWVRAEDGTIQLVDNAGHTHKLLSAPSVNPTDATVPQPAQG